MAPAIDNQHNNVLSEEEKQLKKRQTLLRETRPFWVAMLVLLLLGLLIAWCWQGALRPQVGLLYLTLALGCISAGAFIGFLFGIPNTNQPKRNLADVAAAGTATATDQPSTNLEQVSDWLTKIIIGVGLVEATRIKNALAALGRLVSQETTTAGVTNGTVTVAAVAGSEVVPQVLVVLFGILGFACGYIWTRLYYSSVQMVLDFTLRQTLEQVAANTIAIKAVAAKATDLDAKTAVIAATAAVAKDVATGIATNEKARVVTSATPAPNGVTIATADISPELAQWQQNLQKFLDAKPDFKVDDTHDIFEPDGQPLLPASQNGRTLRVIKVAELTKNTFYFKVEVVGTPDDPLTGEVTLLLHPTYRRRAVRLMADTLNQPEGLATYSFPAAGSFTVVAMMDNGRTVLGFNLLNTPGLPSDLPPNW